MAWYAYIRTSNGDLVSLGTNLVVPDDLDIVPTLLAIDPTDPAWMYDQTTRTFISRPAKVLRDRLDDITSDPIFTDNLVALWNTLNAANRTRLRNGLILLLGRHRFRNVSESVEVT